MRTRPMILLLKQSNPYQGLLAQLERAYIEAWETQAQRAVATAIDHLREVGMEGRFTADDAQMVMTAFETALGQDAMISPLYTQTLLLSEVLYRLGVEEVARATGLQVQLQPSDLDILDVIGSGNSFWLGGHWDSYTKRMLERQLSPLFDQTLTRQQVAERIEEAMPGVIDRGEAYWRLVTDNMATRTRESGRVTGYERTGIFALRIKAVIDDRTSDICRALNGRVIMLDSVVAHRNEYVEALRVRDREAAKAAWPMLDELHAADVERYPDNLAPPGIGSPPYHFYCRTRLVLQRMD